jgi:hypothetical protein
MPPSSSGPVTQRNPVLASQGRPHRPLERVGSDAQSSAVPSSAKAAEIFITMATSAGGPLRQGHKLGGLRPAHFCAANFVVILTCAKSVR